MTLAYIALGANIGDRALYLQKALQQLNAHADIDVETLSSIYETEPVGYQQQDLFLNMAVAVQTRLSAMALLREMLAIETALHRHRSVTNGPRTIDLDLLMYGNHQLAEPSLQIPHPRMTERAFVLRPLKDIAPQLRIPGCSKSITALLECADDRNGLRIWRRSIDF